MRSRSALAAGVGAVALLVAACNPILGPTPTDANWTVVERGRFTFYVRPASFAAQSVDVLGDVLDDQFASSVRALDLRYNGHITLFLYNSGEDAGFSDDAGSGDHSGVAYSDTETVKAACVPPLDANLMSLLSHEINHVIVRNGLGRTGTSFVNEGLASALLSERYHALGRTFFHHWVATNRGQVPPLAQLVDDDRWQDYPAHVAYRTSASFLAYLLETHGPGPMRLLYSAPSSQFAARFQTAYGISLEQAEAVWLAYVNGR